MANLPRDKSEFLQNMKNAREERALDKKKEEWTIKIQSYARGFLARRRIRSVVLEEYDRIINDNLELKPALEIYRLIKRISLIWKKDVDQLRFIKLCRYLIRSLEDESSSRSYIGVFLNKEHSLSWIEQLKVLSSKCNHFLRTSIKTFGLSEEEQTSIVILLNFLVSFTSVKTWRILDNQKNNLQLLKPNFNNICKNIIGCLVQEDFYFTIRNILNKYLLQEASSTKSMSHACLTATIVLACRPIIYSDFSDSIMCKFVVNFFCTPAIVYYARTRSPEFLLLFEKDQLLMHLMKFLNKYVSNTHSQDGDNSLMEDLVNLEKSNNLLCLTANFIELVKIHLDSISQKRQEITNFVDILRSLSLKCREGVNFSRSSNLTQWHPILGWSSKDDYDINLHDCLPVIKQQIALLWSCDILNILLEEPLAQLIADMPAFEMDKNEKKNLFKRKAMNILNEVPFVNMKWRNRDIKISVENLLIIQKKNVIATACHLYYLILNTFLEVRLDILTSLCYKGNILSSLWKYLSHSSVIKAFYRHVSVCGNNKDDAEDDFHILLLFSECMMHYITILDDVEMYEDQSLFTIDDFISLSSFLNNFLYKGITNEFFCANNSNKQNDNIFSTTHGLLTLLYVRDCRRPYTSSKAHWVIKDFKMNFIYAENDKHERKITYLKNKMPHVIQYSDRVHMFKKMLFDEKCSVRPLLRQDLDGPYDLISNSALTALRVFKIRRNRIVEDAFHIFQKVDNVDMKQAFKIKFVNPEGLEEAGVDQAGIFKEFIVDLVKKLFDPSLNLFRKTAQGHYYPSQVTSMSEINHLDLVEFSGLMLGKAVYEGIVLDVRLASFFLNQILGQTQSNLYSYIDDLPSMDEELYRSLMCVKHYEGDVSDLALTFSTTEDVFGSIVTRELVPNGKIVNVTNENKIIYVHMMAHFRMHTQIKQQTAAFSKGFHSLFNKELLSLFSVPELQLLISGEDQPLDFVQLRQHTQYYGGFHDSHKVIVWLWDILINDFAEKERVLFLKFVTSSSRPPVLGFAFLNPPFSIRCVEVSEDEDRGDSVGSVIRGFFTIRKKVPELRLPTSSTCFNLLKLPSYSRKNILKEKLKYAITANSGFELS